MDILQISIKKLIVNKSNHYLLIILFLLDIKLETTTNKNQSGFIQQECKYGNECRNQSDPTHCNRYSHPISTLSTQLLNAATTSPFHTCNTGDDMQQAYRIGGALAIEKLSQSDQIAIQNMP